MNFTYQEPDAAADDLRRAYLDGVDAYIRARNAEAYAAEPARVQAVLRDPETARAEFCRMLGAPLDAPVTEVPTLLHREKLFTERGVTASRMQFCVLGCIPFYGILYVRDESRPAPFALVSHGGMGTPELCSGLLSGGSANYNDMVTRVLDRGLNVFAPQLLLWALNRFPVRDRDDQPQDELRLRRDDRLKKTGSSITALEIYALRAVLNYFERQPYVDPRRIGMAGLSYGGFYTLMTTAAEPRIRAALSGSAFNDRLCVDFPDWTWASSAVRFPDSAVLALIAPRPIWIAVGRSDPLFRIENAQASYDRFAAAAGAAGSSVHFVPFDGDHEFCPMDAPLDAFAAALRGEANAQ